MSDFHNSDLGFSQVRCRIFKDFDVGFSTTQMAPISFRTEEMFYQRHLCNSEDKFGCEYFYSFDLL